ncbi:MAG: hypothetical protein Q8S33_26270 [Myxococcales bacterium]|nr:hypothetical protein [Myxococcales bacterium]
MSLRLALGVGLLVGLFIASCREPCDAETCAGCCDASGECQVGTQVAACGRRGQECSTCSPGGSCTRQVCVGGSAADGGTDDAGTIAADGGCSIGLCGEQICNVVSGACETGASCDLMTAQPAGCGSGHVCTAAGCRDVARPRCMNFGPQSAPLRWNPGVNFGPVITAARGVSFAVDDGGCPVGSARRAVVELVAYDFRSGFVDGGYPRLFLYREGQTFGTVTSGVSVAAANQGGTATLLISQCGPESVTSLTLGYAFENGNGVCVSLP